MTKTILITGATDGIGLETAKMLVELGHKVLVHGRNPAKLQTVASELSGAGQSIATYQADLSQMAEVSALAIAVAEQHPRLDVLMNNAGVYATAHPITQVGLDVRFVVNAIAPYLLTQRLLPQFGQSGRVINVSSAAQAPVNLMALAGATSLSDSAAYAQSKLALTMWSRHLGLTQPAPSLIAVNPGSLLGSKMVKQTFGIAGGDIRIGADILARAALSEEFASASGQYYDNDAQQFAPPHPDALNLEKSAAVVDVIETLLAEKFNLQ